MPEINCECGAAVAVELWEAGVSKSCPRCGSSVGVPPLDTLKRLQGDKHPYLNSLQKLVRASELREHPFDGVCHSCNSNDALVEIPISLSIMTERQFEDESPLLMTPVSISVNVSGGTESWETFVFPLQFCHACHAEFRSSFRSRSILFWGLRGLFAVAALVGFLIALPCGALGVAGLLYLLIAGTHRRKSKDLRFDPWLKKISLVRDALAQESEYRLRKGKARELG